MTWAAIVTALYFLFVDRRPVVAFAAIVIGLPFAIGYYYFRAKSKNMDAGLAAVRTLANEGRAPKKRG